MSIRTFEWVGPNTPLDQNEIVTILTRHPELSILSEQIVPINSTLSIFTYQVQSITSYDTPRVIQSLMKVKSLINGGTFGNVKVFLKVPVTISNIEQIIVDAITVVKAFVNQILHINPDDVFVLRSKMVGTYIIKFVPIYKNKPVYMNLQQQADFNLICDLNRYMGYRAYYDKTGLANFILENQLLQVNVADGIKMLTVLPNVLLISGQNDAFFNQLDYQVNQLQQSGILVIGSNRTSNIQTLSEIVSLWDGSILNQDKIKQEENELILSNPNATYIAVKPVISLPPSNKLFYEQALRNIVRNDPIRTFIRLEPSISQLRYHVRDYVTIRAYAQLVNEYPSLSEHLMTFRSGENQINPAIENLVQLQKLQVYLNDFSKISCFKISQDDNIKTNCNSQTLQYNLHIANNFEEMVIMRYHLLKLNPLSVPIAFSMSDGQYEIVSISPSSNNQNVHIQSDDIERGRNELIVLFREYFTKCLNEEDLSSLTNISEMDLNQLLQLIPITDPGSKVTHCILTETIRGTKRDVNPFTRVPFSLKTQNYIYYLNQGLEGLFTVGPIAGLLPESPYRQPLIVTRGRPILTKVQGTKGESILSIHIEYLTEDIYKSPYYRFDYDEFDPKAVVNEHFVNIRLREDETVNTINEFEILIPKLWSTGMLFSEWGYSLYRDTNKFSVNLLRHEPMLIAANSSIEQGRIALNFLRSLAS